MYDINKLMGRDHFNQLMELLPTPKQRKTGRPRVSKEALLSGILQVLVLDIPWSDPSPLN